MKALWLSLALLWAGSATAQAVPEGEPRVGRSVRDSDFGVSTRQFGLDRRVEMYQWRADGDGYARTWNAARIDSTGFAPGHENPPGLPLDSRRWWPRDASLDGKPLDISVLHLLGEWRGFRPNFSQLPGNLAATFQPEGDGLGSSENPLDPQIGDLRVSWRELVLPPLAGKVQLDGGRWRLAPKAAAAPVPTDEAIEEVDEPGSVPSRRWPWWVGGLLVLVLAWGVARRRSRGKA